MCNWKKKYDKQILRGNLDAAKGILDKYFKTCKEDEKIYKFFPGRKYNLEGIKDKKIYLSRADQFNDPFDCLFLENCHSKEVYDQLKEVDLAYEEYEKQCVSDKKSEKIRKSIYVTCFSESMDNNSMWSYYADEHKGFCAEYKLKDLYKEHGILPIVYVDKKPVLDENNKNYKQLIALIKHSSWKHEKEWRIVKCDEHEEKDGITIAGIMPTAIYLGCNNMKHIDDNYKVVKNIYGFCSDSQDYDTIKNQHFNSDKVYISLNEFIGMGIKLYEMRLSKIDFTLEKCKLING